jgi:adenosine deaminase
MHFRSLPKVELHLHLDCSLSYAVASRLSPGLSREDYERDFVAPPRCESLADFLTRAPSGFQLLQDREALRLATEDLFQQLGEDGVVYAEIRFAPLLHTERGLTPEAAVEAVDRATEEAVRVTGIEARLILCSLRHYSEAQSLETARLLERFAGSRVVALDLAADEAGHPIDAHVPAFRYAFERGFARTAHAGEARGAESVWETLRELQPSRLGHGVRSIEDPALVEHLVRSRVHLEICPSCNVQIGICDSHAGHPIDRLYRAGVSLGVNTDARTLTRVTLSEEYEKLHGAFGWGPEHFRRCNLNALAAAFADEATKERLRPRLTAAFMSASPPSSR